jgi:hypothetical protein
LSCCSSNGGRTESTHTGWAKPTQGSPMRIGEEGGGEKIGTVLAEAEEGGAAQQQWHRTASECAEAPRRGALKEGGASCRVAWARGCARFRNSFYIFILSSFSKNKWSIQFFPTNTPLGPDSYRRGPRRQDSYRRGPRWPTAARP